MGKADFFKGGDWNIIGDISGRKIKASQAKKRWDNAIDLPEYIEPRHPQYYVKGVRDDQSVPFSRPNDGYDATLITPGVPSQV